MVDFLHFLKNTSYPGRGILVGKDRVYYFIMGRSENSRNRVFVKTDDGIRTEAFDPAKLADPSLIIYHPVRTMGSDLVVTNGADDGRDHARGICVCTPFLSGKKSGVHVFSVPDDDSGGAGHDHQLRDDHTVGHAQQLCRIGTAVRDLGILHLFIERKF